MDGGVDGGAGGHGHALLLHVVHHHLLLHPLPLRFLLCLLLHQLHPQPDARRHGETPGREPRARLAQRSPCQEDTAHHRQPCTAGKLRHEAGGEIPERPRWMVTDPRGSSRCWRCCHRAGGAGPSTQPGCRTPPISCLLTENRGGKVKSTPGKLLRRGTAEDEDGEG